MLRYVGATAATVWLETDAPCAVEILGHTETTFAVEGRHYAIVVVEELEPGTTYEYGVRLDGEPVWPRPESGLPPSAIRTVSESGPVALAFGSCRVTAPHELPYTRRRASDKRGYGVDALRALAHRLAKVPPEERPDLLLMAGDQIYADQPPDDLLEHLRSRNPVPGAPPDQLEDFVDYALCYCDAWDDAPIRWLLSTVATAMIFDDHEIHDAWKVSKAWEERMRRHDWYGERIAAGLSAYWLYQHLGNLSPAELRENELLRRCREAEDAGELLHAFASTADRQIDASRWSFVRDLGATRIVVVDSRAARHLEPGERTILNDDEWEWIREQVADEGYDNLVLVSSVPFLVTPALHDLEAWNEALCDGRWGSTVARLSERFRVAANLNHWAAFQRSFHRLTELLDELSAGRLRRAPASIWLLSGDVHHCYAAEARWPGDAGGRTPVWQAVCSGMRKPLDPGEKIVMKAVASRPVAAVARALAGLARTRRPAIDWSLVDGPVYANQIGSLTLGDEATDLSIDTTVRSPRVGMPTLDPAIRRRVPTVRRARQPASASVAARSPERSAPSM